MPNRGLAIICDIDHPQYVWSKTRLTRPWITSHIRRMCRKKQKMLNSAKSHHRWKYWEYYTFFKRDVTRTMRKARWEYINGIFHLGLEEGNSRPFWRYINSQKQDNVGIPALWHKGNLWLTISKTRRLWMNNLSLFSRKTTLNQSLVKTGP